MYGYMKFELLLAKHTPLPLAKDYSQRAIYIFDANTMTLFSCMTLIKVMFKVCLYFLAFFLPIFVVFL